jgi:hypothetical protein
METPLNPFYASGRKQNKFKKKVLKVPSGIFKTIKTNTLMESALVCVKRYTTLRDYCSMILVNKEWNSIIKSMEGSLKLVKMLRYSGYMGAFADKYLSKMNFRETIELFIESVEPCRNYTTGYRLVYKPYTIVQQCRINKRLNYLNLF